MQGGEGEFEGRVSLSYTTVGWPSIRIRVLTVDERDIGCGRAYNGGGLGLRHTRGQKLNLKLRWEGAYARSGSPPQCILGRAADRVEGGR